MPAKDIDFSSLRFNLTKISESRILSQYITSPLFKKLLGAFTSEIQELMDAIVDLMEYRTLTKPEAKPWTLSEELSDEAEPHTTTMSRTGSHRTKKALAQTTDTGG